MGSDHSPEHRAARLNYKQAIIVALITAVTSIAVTLISSGVFDKAASDQGPPADGGVCDRQETEIKALETQLGLTLNAEDLYGLSNRYFTHDAAKLSLKDSIRELVDQAEEWAIQKRHYTYRLFQIKKTMLNKPRRNINTRIDDDPPSTYKLIQQILKEIEYYKGAIDGDRMETYQALRSFQEAQRQYDTINFKPTYYGIFGNATLTAIMQLYDHGQ